MEKIISLKKLNVDGSLISMFKNTSFYLKTNLGPLICTHANNSPNVCYLHFYKGMYYVTDKILIVRQQEFINFCDAEKEFLRFVSEMCHA